MLAGLVLLGAVGLWLWLAATAQASSNAILNTLTATPDGYVSTTQVQVSSAYTTNSLPTPPPITGPTSTAPDTVAAAPPPPGSSPSDPWRWWLVGVMVLLAGFFLVRGLRRQRRP